VDTRTTLPPLHKLEAEVMEEVWAADGEVTVHAVRDALNARSEKQRAYTTVMTVMRRLDDKGLLEREKRGRRDGYVAAFTREEYRDARAAGEVQQLLAEYGDIALAHFAERVDGLDPERREQLRRLARGG
jgi:predicted transcriptional regulator